MSAWFVTATGTDIGKTFVTAEVIRILIESGRAAAALKPVISGSDAPEDSDSGILLRAMGERVTADTLDRISPWRFEAPLSPDMAAAREGRAIDFDALVEFCHKRIAAAEGPLFVEGVGGVMVPLDGTHTVLDWMAALGLPLILVTGSYLGTLSHTLTALDTVARVGLLVEALVVNESPASPVPLAETVASLARFAPGIPIVTVARGKSADLAPLATLLGGH